MAKFKGVNACPPPEATKNVNGSKKFRRKRLRKNARKKEKKKKARDMETEKDRCSVRSYKLSEVHFYSIILLDVLEHKWRASEHKATLLL